jgi:hypothetical protein
MVDIEVQICSYSFHARGATQARSQLACQAGIDPSIPCAARSRLQQRKRQKPGGVSRSLGPFASPSPSRG